MYFAHIALAAATIIALVKGQDENKESQENHEDNESGKEKQDNALDSNQTFVALIDIVFMDNSKRTCTGAIVHDNVVITVAHCFLGKDELSSSKPELTASFVVIGTKKMFDTGYEQYLPIERIVVHPKYEGWTADLALVFTFAGMTSDKPGSVIPLAGDKPTAHLDSNVTLFSWGHARKIPTSLEDKTDEKKYEKYTNVEVFASDESSASDVGSKTNILVTNTHKTQQNTAAMVEKRFRNEQDDSSPSSHRFKKKKSLRSYRHDKNKGRHGHAQEDSETRTSIRSRYLTVIHSTENIESSINPYVYPVKASYENFEKKLKTRRLVKYTREKSTKPYKTEDVSEAQMAPKQSSKKMLPRLIYRFKSNGWRRSMGSQQNRLLVENFGFVNLFTCRTLVDKALPAKYNISKHNDVICYTNSDRCVNENDSGAPAVRQGQLVAITVGGAECDGDHVTIGMKMACYCSWISDNLPPGSSSFTCCKNCCDVKHKEEKKKERRHRFRNKFIL